MIDFSISLTPFFVILFANFILSWLYYSPLAPWFKTWLINIGLDPNKTEMTEEDKKAMPRLMGGAVLSSGLLSYGLQIIIHSLNVTTFINGMIIGFVVWITFALTHSLNTQFEGRKPIVLLINNILYLTTYCLFCGIIAVM